jgi:tripeptide aminopeptidase
MNNAIANTVILSEAKNLNMDPSVIPQDDNLSFETSSTVVETFLDLIQIDSVTGEEERLREFIVNLLRQEDLVDVLQVDDYGNLYARSDGVGEPHFLAAHMDTVEPGRGIKPQIIDGVIRSDGTTILGADNKVAIAGIIDALRQIKGIPHRPIEVIFTRSEEVGNYGASNFDYSLLRARKGYCFDMAAPIGSFAIASPYYERIDLTLIGREAHASSAEEGINVLLMFQHILDQWKLGRLDNETIFNIGVIEGGFVRNTIPGKMRIEAEIRGFDESKLERFREDFKGVIREIGEKYGGEYEIDVVRENPGYKLSPQLVEHTSKIISRAGFEPNPIDSWSVSDANIFHEHGLECINLGDGSQGAHTLKEIITVKNLQNLVQTITFICQ